MTVTSDETGRDAVRRPNNELAYSVDTVIVPERGLWAVDIVVVFADGIVRKRIDTYRTQRLAEIHAGYIKRGAEREIGGGPVNG